MNDSGLTFTPPAFAGRIGVERADITPPDGIYARNWGASRHDAAQGVHRPLTATALTIQSASGGSPVVLYSLDLGWWRSREDEHLVRYGVLQGLSLGPGRVMIALTHTHAGPSLCHQDVDKPGGHLVAPYLMDLCETLVSIARRALATARPATLEWATGRCTLAVTRNVPDPKDPAHYLTGFDPNAPPADDTLLVGRVTDEVSGATTATLVNYACHPTTLGHGNRKLSPDYVGALRERLEAGTRGAPCLFLQGASGDLAPREQYTDDPDVADSHGRCLGYAALSVLEEMLPPRTRLTYKGELESGAPLALYERETFTPSTVLEVRCPNVDLELKPLPSLAELEAEIKACPDRAMTERLRRKRQVRRYVGNGTSVALPVWYWRIGGALLVGTPTESYSILQKNLRATFPEEAVVVMNVVNGWYGYLPPADDYDCDQYAVWQTPFAAGSLERLEAASREELIALGEIAVEPLA